jgi:hypothetical protein
MTQLKSRAATHLGGSRVHEADFIKCIVRMIVSARLPLTHFNNPEVQRTYYCLTKNDDLKFSNPTSIKNAIIELLGDTIKEIKVRLHEPSAKHSNISLQVDGWSQCNSRSGFFAIIGHWVDADMKWQEALLGFQPTSAAHSGIALSGFLQRVIETYDIRDRLVSITADNASPNKTMVENLQTALGLDQGFSTLLRIPCLAHVFQLAQGELLQGLKCKPTNEEIIRSFDHGMMQRERTALRDGLRAKPRRVTTSSLTNDDEGVGEISLTLWKV